MECITASKAPSVPRAGAREQAPDILGVHEIGAGAEEALAKYGETLDIRRDSLQSLFPGGSEVQIPRVRLIYEGGDLKPRDVNLLKKAVNETKAAVPGVEVVLQ